MGEFGGGIGVGHLLSYPCGGVHAMGVLYDYFRAEDDAAAVRLVEDFEGGPLAVGHGGAAVDAVDLKGIEPTVILGQLVGFVRQVDWNASLIGTDLVWSEDEQEGPWLMSLDRATRDTLASIATPQMPELSARWGRTEELARSGPLPDDEMLPVIDKVAALVQRARDAGEGLYCWCSF
ncbi:hypothetical protein [Micromonospora sp. NPDC049204]|uniref:hypothetical protein n=1 Tax=Micromonospora sp. NPDC049204 TaxID=3154351 RepID=UPI0033EA4473